MGSNRLLKNPAPCFDELSMSGSPPRVSYSFPLTLSLSKGLRSLFQQPAKLALRRPTKLAPWRLCVRCEPIVRARSVAAVCVALLAIVAVACSGHDKVDDEGTLMQAGLEALHTRHDPNGAAAQFRKVLELNPTHYGATFQLAAALEAAGRPQEARPYWEKMRVMAEAANDTQTIEAVRAHLPDAGTDAAAKGADAAAALMQAGLDAVYTRRDPNAAVIEFRKVLDLNPTHYGATYQLAAALEAAGQPDEARLWWSKMLQLAEAINDTKTADTVRTHLAAATPEEPSPPPQAKGSKSTGKPGVPQTREHAAAPGTNQ